MEDDIKSSQMVQVNFLLFSHHFHKEQEKDYFTQNGVYHIGQKLFNISECRSINISA